MTYEYFLFYRAQRFGGYIPSNVYLRSSYRTKQYPTLSTRPQGPMKAVWNQEPDPRSQTLPVPYKNRFDLNTGCDSPVGLYNCPQQRTSQAFSSLDDLDGLAGMGPPPTRRPDSSTHYPSLERSARKKQKPIHLSSAAIIQAAVKSESRSLENLEVLENAGARRARNRMPNPQVDTLAAREQALDDLVYRTNQTTLKSAEEYPSAAGYDDVDGSYPALPLPARRTTLLPGQTYPEPVSACSNLLTHSHTVSSLREALSPPHLVSGYSHTYTVHARKIETTFGLNDSVRTNSVISSDNESPKLTQRQGQTEDVKPPLFPKQYYNSVKQRHTSIPITENSESPAVPRKLKPAVAISPAAAQHTSLNSQSPQTGEVNTSFDAQAVPAEVSGPGVSGCFVPYRETSKPFEMADFYKYSTKFRKASASSLRSTESESPRVPGSESPGSGSGSQRSSTSRESVPPELPSKPGSGTVSAVPAVARMPLHKSEDESLADAFSTEMLAWYEQKQSSKPNSNTGKPATLV